MVGVTLLPIVLHFSFLLLFLFSFLLSFLFSSFLFSLFASPASPCFSCHAFLPSACMCARESSCMPQWCDESFSKGRHNCKAQQQTCAALISPCRYEDLLRTTVLWISPLPPPRLLHGDVPEAFPWSLEAALSGPAVAPLVL